MSERTQNIAMNTKILVTYATCTGSTAQVAEVVANTLRKSGTVVELTPIQEVTDLTPYHAIVIGSPVQNRQWLPKAVEFVQTNRSVLRKKKIAMFTLCITLAMRNGEKFRPDVFAWIAPVRTMLQPISEGLFAGVLDISKIPSFSDRLKFRLSVLFGVWSQGDHRNWDAINVWVLDLQQQLK